MYCERCGKELKKDIYFCDGCGEPVKLDPVQEKGLQKLLDRSEKETHGKTDKYVLRKVVFSVLAILLLLMILIFVSAKRDISDFITGLEVVSVIGLAISLLIWIVNAIGKKNTGPAKTSVLLFFIVFVASLVADFLIVPPVYEAVPEMIEKLPTVEVSTEIVAEEPEPEPTEDWKMEMTYELVVYHLSDSSAIAYDTNKEGDSALYLTVQEKINKLPVIAIADNAFQGCRNLKNIELPGTLEKIGAYAFSNCPRIQRFKLPDSIVEIGDYAFEGCSSLTELRIPENVTRLEANTFKDTNLQILYIPDTCEIPEGDDPFGLGENCRIEIYETE